MRRIRLDVEYDGTRYHGWQRQGTQSTVQLEIERAIRRVTHERVTVLGAGRTDAGVHAEGQVAAFDTESKLPARKFREGLNAHLPLDIAVVDSSEAALDFHPQFHVKSKRYRYAVLNRGARPALLRDRAALVRGAIDVELMRRAARSLVGTRDFRSFTSQASLREDTTRTIFSLDVRRESVLIVFDVEGDGFLYNMVRAIVGTLLDVGKGKRGPDDVERILEMRDRRRAGANAPACGLTLVSVTYE